MEKSFSLLFEISNSVSLLCNHVIKSFFEFTEVVFDKKIFIGTHDSNLQLASKILNDMFTKYPNCIFFHLFAARLEELKGNIDRVSALGVCVN